MDEREIRERLNEVRDWFMDIDKNLEQVAKRDTGRDAETVARAHRDGYRQVAGAIQQGFELLATAIRDKR